MESGTVKFFERQRGLEDVKHDANTDALKQLLRRFLGLSCRQVRLGVLVSLRCVVLAND